MTLRLLVPILLGLCSVLQAGLNRKVAARFDLSQATLMSSGVLFVVSLMIFLSTLRGRGAQDLTGGLQAWHIVPGCLGVCLVAGIPWAISKWGATAVFVSLVASQTIASLAWDALVEGRTVNYASLMGVLLSVLGIVCVNFGK